MVRRTIFAQDRDADEQVGRPTQVHPPLNPVRQFLAKNSIDATVVCEDPVGPDDARIPGHHVDPAVRVALGAEAYFALSDCRRSPGQNGACARIGGRFRDQLAGVPSRPVDEHGSAHVAKPPRPSGE
jgi:hypothetical protein